MSDLCEKCGRPKAPRGGALPSECFATGDLNCLRLAAARWKAEADALRDRLARCEAALRTVRSGYSIDDGGNDVLDLAAGDVVRGRHLAPCVGQPCVCYVAALAEPEGGTDGP